MQTLDVKDDKKIEIHIKNNAERDNLPQILEKEWISVNNGERNQDFQNDIAEKNPIKNMKSSYDMRIDYEDDKDDKDDKDLKNSTRRNRQEREQHKQVKIVTFESNFIEEQKNMKIRRTRQERSSQIIN